MPEEPHPKAEGYGRSSKIYRYYWREIAFETISRFGEWAEIQGYESWLAALTEYKEHYKNIERGVVNEIKKLHQVSPKYTYQEESQSQILSKYQVDIVNLDGVFVKTAGRGVAILEGKNTVSAEEFVMHHYKKKGYDAIMSESVPFHALFGTFMWLLIQHPSDDKCRVVSFGDRVAFEDGEAGETVWTRLPEDFGTIGYHQRRHKEIKEHLQFIPDDREELLWTFDYWTEPSYPLRQYLWAHRGQDVAKARQIASILPVPDIKNILRYLVEAYWKHYLGWPDLILYRGSDFFFAEVKASKDKLSEDQKSWIHGNSQRLNLSFRLVKIHKRGVLEQLPD